jgi:glycosyltransferase involved in cell wall biosynthesis
MSSDVPQRKKSLLIISEPMDSPDAVQLKFVSSVGRALTSSFRVTVATVFITTEASRKLEELGFRVISPGRDHFWINRILHKAGRRSEATLWTEAWVREALFGRNRRLLARLLAGQEFDFVVNTTNTAAFKSDVWWIQGPPLYITLGSILHREGRSAVPLGALCRIIRPLDERVLDRLSDSGRIAVANSNYVREYYERTGLDVRATLYSICDLSKFRPKPRDGEAPYVLAYIGKETELDTLYELAHAGIRIVGFGDKLVPGMQCEQLRQSIDFRGRVDQDHLVELYSGAEFTVFPFTNEPFGYVPVESMACGTPVLTYGKEGPAETVVNGETGWLVHSRDEFVRKASSLWHGFDRVRYSARSVWRASQFQPEAQARALVSLLIGPPGSGEGPGHVPPSRWSPDLSRSFSH